MFLKKIFSCLQNYFFRPADGSSLVCFRVFFGLLMAWHIFYDFNSYSIYAKFINPKFLFSFSLFEALHLRPLSAYNIFFLFKVIGVAAVTLALGLCYRISCLIFLLGFFYFFLLEKAFYNNHEYLLILMSFLLMMVQANRELALDQWFSSQATRRVIPYWNIFILRAQIVIVYFFAGVAKINQDWLQHGLPVRLWVKNWNFHPEITTIINEDFLVYFLCYGGLVFDLAIGFLLWFKKTRFVAFPLCIIFHLTNRSVFQIGIFPYFMLGTLLLFVEPDTPRKFLRRLFKIKTVAFDQGKNESKEPVYGARHVLTSAFIIVYLCIQIAVPLRHWVYPGDVDWYREGHRFSWRMKITDTKLRIKFFVQPHYDSPKIEVNMQEDLTVFQIFAFNRPDMIVQYANYLEEKHKKKGFKDPVITVDAWLSLNGRPFYRYVDPNVDLGNIKMHLFSHAEWILPPP